jgi:hypothetical protein
MSKQDDDIWLRMRGSRYRRDLLRAVCGYCDYVRYNASAARKQTCRTSGRPSFDPNYVAEGGRANLRKQPSHIPPIGLRRLIEAADLPPAATFVHQLALTPSVWAANPMGGSYAISPLRGMHPV